MNLYELLNLIEPDSLPLHQTLCGGIDSRPNSTFTITLSFMADTESWITVPVGSEILIPWYDCEVYSINGSDKPDDIQVWLCDTEYVKKFWKRYVCWVDETKPTEGGNS